MTISDYYDYVDDFYRTYTKGISDKEALKFNRWLTRIIMLASTYEESFYTVEELKIVDIKEWYEGLDEELKTIKERYSNRVK